MNANQRFARGGRAVQRNCNIYRFNPKNGDVLQMGLMERGKAGDDWPTDEWIMGIFDDWFDPCPLGAVEEYDGLAIEWPHKTFVNPPYSNVTPWIKKGINEARFGKTIAFLLKHDSSTQWYRLLHETGAKFLMVQGRLKHGGTRHAAFPSIVAILHWSKIK